MNKLKAFIGPLGDDIPTLLIIIGGLGLFFASLSFAFEAYNAKTIDFRELKGAIDISRIATQNGLVSEPLSSIREKSIPTANSYGLDFAMEYSDGSDKVGDSNGDYCEEHDNWLRFNFLTAVRTTGDDIELKTLTVCAGGVVS